MVGLASSGLVVCLHQPQDRGWISISPFLGPITVRQYGEHNDTDDDLIVTEAITTPTQMEALTTTMDKAAALILLQAMVVVEVQVEARSK